MTEINYAKTWELSELIKAAVYKVLLARCTPSSDQLKERQTNTVRLLVSWLYVLLLCYVPWKLFNAIKPMIAKSCKRYSLGFDDHLKS